MLIKKLKTVFKSFIIAGVQNCCKKMSSTTLVILQFFLGLLNILKPQVHTAHVENKVIRNE